MASAEQIAIRAGARIHGRRWGLGVTSWAASTPASGQGGALTSAGTVTGTIFQEAKPTWRAAAPGLPPVGVRRWLLVLESGTVAVGTVLTGGAYTFRVAAPDAEPIDVWEVVKH